MLRTIILGLALSLLATACALVEQPPPPGTRVIEVEVRNQSTRPLELLFSVSETEAALPGAVRPSSVPPESTVRVALYVPVAGRWRLLIDPTSSMSSQEFVQLMAPGCTMIYIETYDAEPLNYGCT